MFLPESTGKKWVKSIPLNIHRSSRDFCSVWAFTHWVKMRNRVRARGYWSKPHFSLPYPWIWAHNIIKTTPLPSLQYLPGQPPPSLPFTYFRATKKTWDKDFTQRLSRVPAPGCTSDQPGTSRKPPQDRCRPVPAPGFMSARHTRVPPATYWQHSVPSA